MIPLHQPLSLSLLLLLIISSLEPVRASTALDVSGTPTNKGLHAAGAALSIIFALLALCQLVVVALPGCVWKNSTPLEKPLEPFSEPPCRYKQSYRMLMGFSLLTFIVKYSLREYILLDAQSPYAPGAFVSYKLAKEVSEELVLAAIFALLASCAMASARWRTGGAVTSIRGALNWFSIPFVGSMIIIMALGTFSRMIVISSSKDSPRVSATVQLVSDQVHVLISLILSIYFTFLSASMWKTRDGLACHSRGSVEVGNIKYGPVDMTRRLFKQVSPLLCTLTLYNVIFDILTYLGGGNRLVVEFMGFLIEGLAYFFLILATLCAAFASR